MKILENTKLQYILITLLIYLSGNVYFRNFNYSKSIVLVLILFILIYFLTTVRQKIKFKVSAILLLFVFAILMASTILINQETKISSYIAIYLQMIIAVLACKIIPVYNFKRFYLNIITFFAISSLMFHFVGLLNPQVVLIFPKTEAIASTDYYNAIIHVYQTHIGYGRLVYAARNAGIFWEPGAYQAFLNIGLIFFFDLISKGDKSIKRKRLMFFALLLAIITTHSTTGYIISAIIIIFYWKELNKILTIKNFKDVFFTIVILAISISIATKEIILGVTLIAEKYVSGSQSTFERISIDKLRLIFFDTKSFLFGLSFSNNYQTGKIWNSIIQTAVVLGVPFTLILLFKYLKGSMYFVKKWWLLFLLLVIIFSTENLFWRPLFLYFVFTETNNRLK